MRSTKSQTIVDVLRRWASEQFDHPAFIFLEDGESRESRLSFGALDRRARAIAAKLQQQGAAGSRVLLALPSGLDFIAGFFGCLYAGAVAVPLHVMNAARMRLDSRFRAIAEDCQASIALSTRMPSDRTTLAPGGEGQSDGGLTWMSIEQAEAAEAGEWVPESYDPGQMCILQYTSGSTARPRGVQITHGQLMAGARAIEACFGFSRESTVVSWLPLYHDMGLIGAVVEPVFTGATTVLMTPMAFMQRPARWLEAVSRYRANWSPAPNSAYEMSVLKVAAEEKAKLDLSCWSHALVGAEPVQPGTLERFAEAFKECGFRPESFVPCYGLAEATLLVAGQKGAGNFCELKISRRELGEGRVVREERESADQLRVVSCGEKIAGHKLKIVDPKTRKECPEGTVGEIWFSGPVVAAGYWNRSDESAKTFTACLANNRTYRYLRTGDLGFLDQGQLFVTGRLKELIIINGVNHYPVDIEATVQNSHPGLRGATVASFSIDGNGSEELVLVQEVGRCAADDLDQAADAIRYEVIEGHDLAVRTI